MPEIVSAINLLMEPDKQAVHCLDDQSRKCNSSYNMLLETARQYLESGEKELIKNLYSPYGLRDLIPGLKQAHPYLKSVHSSPLKNTALRLTDAFITCRDSRNGKRKGKKIGMPRFRSYKAGFFSLLYDEPNKGYRIEGNVLILSLGLGTDKKRHSLRIPIKDAHVLKGKTIRSLRIVKKNGIFSAAFTVVRVVPDTKPIKKIIAFDPNHKNFAYGVDTAGRAIEILAPYWLKSYDKRIDELKAKRDRCEKKSKLVEVKDKDGNIIHTYWEESRRYKKLQATLNKLLAKRREHTKAFCYRIANYLFKQYDLVAIGDYTPHGQGLTTSMRRSMNNRSLIGRFKIILDWVAVKSGKSYKEFNETGTTRTCNLCSFIVMDGIHPSIREWQCEGCETLHLRDENAAFNGLKKILRNFNEISGNQLPPVPSSGLGLIKERRAWKVLSSGAIVLRGDKTAAYNLHFQEIKTDGVVAIRP